MSITKENIIGKAKAKMKETMFGEEYKPPLHYSFTSLAYPGGRN